MHAKSVEAEMSSRWCGVVVRRGGASSGVVHVTDHGSKLRGPSPKALVQLNRIRAHDEQLLEFERGRIIELKEAGWETRRIARYMGRSHATLRRCWQEWVEDGRFRRHEGSGRFRATADWEDRLIVGSAVTASDPSLSTIRRTTRTRVSTITIRKPLIERISPSHRPLRPLPLTPARCRAR
ncbi:HTH_Tnp_Tc3_2 domain-containing protein [Trichonephila clavipes]|nr:HTH_Tnp_Tc3_2 domain-containing protein [Trichonephila clavipes]